MIPDQGYRYLSDSTWIGAKNLKDVKDYMNKKIFVSFIYPISVLLAFLLRDSLPVRARRLALGVAACR